MKKMKTNLSLAIIISGSMINNNVLARKAVAVENGAKLNLTKKLSWNYQKWRRWNVYLK